MNLKIIIKDYWHIIAAIIITAYVVGTYYMKIEYINATISKNSTDIEAIQRETYFILGMMQKDYPGINIKEYAKTTKSRNTSPQESASDLNKLKQLSPLEGKTYLMQKGFNKDQIENIYKKPSY